MSRFWDLLSQSVIVQGTVTLALIATVIFLAVTGQPIPELVSSATLLTLGFYFGSKSQQTINHQLRRQ